VILTAYPCIVIATITESLGPVDRGAIYGDPLDAALAAAGLGTVTGGGSQLDASGTVAFVDLEVALADLDGALGKLRETLQQLGAPAGSVLTFNRAGVTSVISVESGEPATSPAGGAPALARRLLDTDSDSAPVRQYDPATIRKTAEQVRASYQSLMVDAYAVGPIRREAYEPTLFTWYDERTAEFTQHGFTALADLQNLPDPSKRELGAGPFARRFVTLDHTHRADIFQMKAAGGDEYHRVMNIVTELSDGTFVWTCTAEQRWDIPPHLQIAYVARDASVNALLSGHTDRLAAHLRAHPGVAITPLASLQDVLDSENRCQARTAAFRRQQQVPSLDELTRLGSEPHLAALVYAELRRMVAPPAAAGGVVDGEWSVTTVELSVPTGEPLSFDALIQYALDQGVMQVGEAGSPLNPFLLYDTGRAHFFVCLAGDGDPMGIALQTLRRDAVRPEACALVIDSRITTADGKKADAIIVMASQRGAPAGVTWGQAYRPKGLLRSFKVLPFRQKVATSLSLFDAANANV
jgi:hypothetical protein